MIELFLDTSFAISLASKNDEMHSRAISLAKRFTKKKNLIVTSQAVLLEIGNSLARQHSRQFCVRYLEDLRSDAFTLIVSLTDQIYDRAFDLFSKRSDKEWGMVDCISFIIMGDRKISDALTADEHFVQAGFRALLREN